MSFNDVSFTDVSFNTVQYPLDTSLCYPDQITTCTDISNNTSDISLSTPSEMDSSCSACSSFQICIQIPCITMDDTSMITMDMSGYGYNIQTLACKNNDGILVQTKITVCDLSCQEINYTPIYITPELNDFLIMDDNEVIDKDYIPESSEPHYTVDASTTLASLASPKITASSPNNQGDISNEIESSDENSEGLSRSPEEYDDESRIMEESFSEFTQSIHSATSKLRKKITHFIHFPKDMKK